MHEIIRTRIEKIGIDDEGRFFYAQMMIEREKDNELKKIYIGVVDLCSGGKFIYGMTKLDREVHLIDEK